MNRWNNPKPDPKPEPDPKPRGSDTKVDPKDLKKSEERCPRCGKSVWDCNCR